MAETENVKTMENLNKDKNERNGIESINDSGIEMNEEKEKMERNLTIKCPWILGQLAWARGSSYPFWPCVVTLDPTTLLYFKVQNKGRSQALMVHVQYFGDGGRHNWVLSHYMIPFIGLEDFKARAKSITPEIKKKDPKFAAAFTPKMGVKKQWGIGVTEASGLMHLSNEDRASIFEPVIPEEKTVQLTNKLKRKLSPKGSKFPSDTPNSSSKKLKKIENDEQSQTPSSTQQSESSNLTEESLSNKIVTAPEKQSSSNASSSSRRKSTRNQNKNSIELPKRQNLRKKNSKLSEEERIRRDEIDFEDYYNLNKDFWKADNADATDEEIRKLLQEIWNDMDAEEKHNNLNRNFDNYRYNLPDNSKAKRVKKTPLHQEKENSKNSENAQHESNKNILQLNGKNVDDSVKTNEVVKNKLSPQKEKNKKQEKDTTVQKEKGKISEKEKNNSDDVNVQKEKNKIPPSNDDNVQKEEKKNTTESIDENVEQKENKSSDSDDKEKVKEKEKISETNEETFEKEANKVNCELIPANDNSQKKNGKPELNENVEKEKKKGNAKTKNSQNAKTKKEKVLKRKNNSAEKEVSTKESNKEKKIADDQSIKG